MLLNSIANRQHDDPVVITGDFNSTEHSTVIRYLKGIMIPGEFDSCPCPMVDSYRMLHPRKLAGTYNLFMGYRFGPKIDFIFIEPRTKVLDSEIRYDRINRRYPSDHFPVTASLQLQYPLRTE